MTPAATFPELLQRLYAEQYTGPLTLQLLHGQPKLAATTEQPRIVLDVQKRPT